MTIRNYFGLSVSGYRRKRIKSQVRKRKFTGRTATITNYTDQVKQQFPSVYLTLISIVQATVFGAWLIPNYKLINQFKTYLTTNPSYIVYMVISFLMIVATWNEYVMGAITFRWIPRLTDSFLPFLIGISEFLVIYFNYGILENSDSVIIPYWYYSFSLFSIFALFAFLNMYRKSRNHDENILLLKRLLPLKRFTVLLVIISIIINLLYGIIIHLKLFPSDNKIDTFAVISILIIVIVFLVSRILYWNIVVGKLK